MFFKLKNNKFIEVKISIKNINEFKTIVKLKKYESSYYAILHPIKQS
jgi:hypothetical protein